MGGCGHPAEIVSARGDFVRRPGSARHSDGGMGRGGNSGHGEIPATLHRNAAPGEMDRRTAGAADRCSSSANEVNTLRKIKNPPAPINDVAGSTVLIVGYGSIGQAVETRLAPFGAKFLRVARTAREGVFPLSKLDELAGTGRHRGADDALDF